MSDDKQQLEQYRKKVEAIAEQEKEAASKAVPPAVDEEVPIEFVKECYNSNEVGDSLLFNHLYRNKFVFNVMSKDTWLKFVGPHWEVDYHRQAKASVEAVALQYLRLLKEVEDRLDKIDDDVSSNPKDRSLKEERKILHAHRKKIIERINRLRSAAGRNAVLSCAVSNYDPLTVSPNELDQYPWLFPCANGIIDLSTGEFTEGGDPQLYLTSASPVKWEGINAKCPTWERFLLEVLGGDQDVVDYLQKVLGYAITGLNTERLFCVFHGPHGQNGKGTIMNIVLEILGSLASTLQTEILMSQRFGKSSSGPSPEILLMKSKRALFAEETERRNSFAAGLLKKFSGGGKLIGRGLNDKDYTEFVPTHLLFLLCNDLPSAPASDDGFWARIKVFTFPYSFLPNPTEDHHRLVDKNIEKKLLAEAPGILAWMVRGCMKWQQSNLVPPDKVASDSRDYRDNEDDIQIFIDERCLVKFDDASPDNRTGASNLYQAYKVWWDANNTTRAMNIKEFSNQLELKGFKKIKSGKIYYQFITLKVPTDEGI